jgi:alanyl-tRNA synthetase
MGGHHAFNYPGKEVYWKDGTVRYHHEFLTKDLGVKPEEIVYKEDFWSGGGNAGPDLESIVRGLEIDTLVFMKFKVANGELIELPIRTVDTGYGIERYTWLSQGTLSCFHAVYNSILDDIMKLAGITNVDTKLVTMVAEQSGLMILEKSADRSESRERVAQNIGVSMETLIRTMVPLENVFAVADHTKCLAFMLAEGVVPSNVRAGYLTRLVIRRTYRLLRALGIEEKLFDIVDSQITYWAPDFLHLREMRDEILTMLKVENKKYLDTLERGGQLAKRVAAELREKGSKEMPEETLVALYDSHGLPPEIVAESVQSEGLRVKVPEDFYAKVAAQHLEEPPAVEEEPIKGLETALSGLPVTRTLYYEDSHIQEFDAKVLRVVDGKYLVLSQTAFYPEGGGQPADHGQIRSHEGKAEVTDVQKIGNVIVHVVKGGIPREGDEVVGSIDWSRRISLMRHHSATHVIMGAARRVLGQHVWQSGAQKEVETSRLDISHYQRLTTDEVQKIEKLANEAVMRMIPVETSVKPRAEAEREHGFRLYQGGAVPGKDIRVVKTGDWEVQACGGTHVKNTGEVGLIKILRTERIQDGVERIIFAAGTQALKAIQKNEELLTRVAETLNVQPEKLEPAVEKLVEEWKESRRERDRLLKELVEKERQVTENRTTVKAQKIAGVQLTTRLFEPVDVDRMIKTGSGLIKSDPSAVALFYGKNAKTARIVVMAGEGAIRLGVDARQIANEAASKLGGGGSGRPDFAQGGGTRLDYLSEAIDQAEKTIRKQLKTGKK